MTALELPQLQALLLGPQGLDLHVVPDGLPRDLNPLLLDVCGVRVLELGHREVAPRSWDWENLLPLLRPGEELLWIVDYVRGTAGSSRGDLSVSLVLRFNGAVLPSPNSMADRRNRFDAIQAHFRRQAFPESEVTALGVDELTDLVGIAALADTAVRGVVGAPSPKVGEDGEPGRSESEQLVYQSLNDVVESCLHLDGFRLTFVLGRVPAQTVAAEFGRVTDLLDQLQPLVEIQRAASESEATGTSGGVTFGETVTKTREESDHLVDGFLRGIAKGILGGREDDDRPLAAYRWENAPASIAESHNQGVNAGFNHQLQTGETTTITQVRNGLKLAVQSLERQAQGLYKARGTGGYRGAVLVMANERHVDLVADSVRGVLAGAQSQDSPLTVFPIEGADRLLLSNRSILDALAPSVPVLTDQQAGRLLLLPEAELPGIRLHRNVFLGRNASPVEAKRTVSIGRFAFSDERGKHGAIEIDADDLFRHVLVCGTTGSGKTRRVLKILNDLSSLGDDIRIVVFESAKRTYRGEFSRFGEQDRPRIYTIGDSSKAPLRINPFFFEPGTSLKRHISILADALSEVMPTEALIGPKLREAIEHVYVRAGWNIERNAHRDAEVRYPTVPEFVDCVRAVAENLEYGGEVKANYAGALLGRARIFLDASFQDLFSHAGDRPLRRLFDRDTILELEGLPPSEIDMPALLLSVVLERLRSHRLNNPNGPKWILVIEEAHNVLPRDAEERRSGREAQGARTLLKNIVRLLQEGRELGIGVIVVDQAPSMLARGVLKNTNTKIVMRLEDGEEIEEMGRALGLDEEVWPDLGVLRTGEAVVKASYMSQPVKSSPYAKDELPARLPDPEFDAIPPDYGQLEAAWAEALRGEGPEPDEAWLKRALGDGPQSASLLRFGLGLAQLASGTLDRRFGDIPAKRAALVTLAASRHRAARASVGRALLVKTVRALVVRRWGGEREPVPPQAIRYAADILAAGSTQTPADAQRKLVAALNGHDDRALLAHLCTAAIRTPALTAQDDPLGFLSAADHGLDGLLSDVEVPDTDRSALRRLVLRSLARVEGRLETLEDWI